jgi:hypothetical protein
MGEIYPQILSSRFSSDAGQCVAKPCLREVMVDRQCLGQTAFLHYDEGNAVS